MLMVGGYFLLTLPYEMNKEREEPPGGGGVAELWQRVCNT